jgi:3-oxoacyl-[acyl-carrier-protein] synthase-3
VDTSPEWIITRTGIAERRVCVEESLTDLASLAAEKALENSKTRAKELDLILCATITGRLCYPVACLHVQQRLGCTCPAFDINAACSGFLFALDVAAGYFSRGRAKKVLVIAAEKLSRITDWTDRRTCVLFGDGAGAAVLGEGDDLLSICLSAQGDTKMLFAPNLSGNLPFRPQPDPRRTSI